MPRKTKSFEDAKAQPTLTENEPQPTLTEETAAPAKPQPVSVSAVKVTAQDVPVSITALGAAQAWTSDTILAQVSGILLSVDFIEGTNVKAAQLLAQVDPAPYRAEAVA